MRNNLPRIKDGAYVINLDEKKSKGTHCLSLLIDRNTAVYFDSFGIEYIPQEVLNKIRDKSIPRNIFRIQLYHFHRTYACRKNFVRLYQFTDIINMT